MLRLVLRLATNGHESWIPIDASPLRLPHGVAGKDQFAPDDVCKARSILLCRSIAVCARCVRLPMRLLAVSVVATQ
jgi:hypothetical protein